MNQNESIFHHYLWLLLIVILFAIGGGIYFSYQTLGLTFILSAAMLILAMENSNMIEAVTMYPLKDAKWKPFLVHFASQRHIALFIFYYHIFVYGYLVVFSFLIVFLGLGNQQYDTVINILLIALFLAAAITILIRRIKVGAMYESDNYHQQ